jgi:K+-transporting ATPase ATPase C chain
MFRQLRAATILLGAITLITGVAYPLVVTLFAQALFPHQANGSLVKEGDRVVGSSLIGQNFSKPEYFWGRLSATSPFPYNAAASSGSNFGMMHPGLKEAAEGRLAALREMGTPIEKVPVDLVTASGSGLDPNISPAAAEFQVERVAASRKLTPDAVRALVQKHTEQRQLGVLGEPRVNVLMLNLDLDRPMKRN